MINRRVVRIIYFLFFCLLMSSCKKELEHPELSDLIYLDIQSEISTAQKLVEAGEKQIEEVEAEILKMPVTDFARPRRKNDLVSMQRKLAMVKQKLAYLEARANARKYFVEDEYPKYFEADRPWPDKEEFEAYKINKRLNFVSRSWSDRVPKPNFVNLKEAALAKEKEKAKAAKGGGHGAAPPPAHGASSPQEEEADEEDPAAAPVEETGDGGKKKKSGH